MPGRILASDRGENEGTELGGALQLKEDQVTEEQKEIEMLAEKLFVAIVSAPSGSSDSIGPITGDAYVAEHGRDIARVSFEYAALFVSVREEMRRHVQG